MQFTRGYKAVFFDLDGTLRHSVPNPADVSTAKARELGLEISDEKARETGRWEHSYWASSNDLRADAERFAKDEAGFWKNYTERRLKFIGANPAQIKAISGPLRNYMHSKFRSKDWVPPEVYTMLPDLQKAGFKLGVLSNRSTTFLDIMDKLELTSYFDIIKAAGELGSWKPNPEVFTPLLEHFDLAPEEAVYIGDNYYADIVGARAAGLAPILYDPRGLFPDADCVRITSFEALPAYL